MFERLFQHFEINEAFSAREQFVEFGHAVKRLVATAGALQDKIKALEAEKTAKNLQSSGNEDFTKGLQKDLQTLQADNEKLQTLKVDLQARKEAVQNDNAALQATVQELKAKLAGAKNTAETVEAEQQQKKAAPNLILVELPPFQQHLFTNVVAKPYTQRFYNRIPKSTQGLLQPLPQEASTKQQISLLLQNIAVGWVLEHHKGAGYLPTVPSACSMHDIQSAITYARTKLK